MIKGINFHGTAFYRHTFALIAIFSLTLMTIACAGKPQANKPTFADTGAGTVAVMPVNNASGNDQVARMLREKAIEEVYFKGYRKFSSRAVDEAVSRDTRPAAGGDKLAPARRLPETLGVDALLYITLTEASIKESPFHVTIDVAASFELVAAGTGQSLWKARHAETKRELALTQAGRQQAAHLILEGLVERVIVKGLSSFPEGPILADGKTRGKN